MSEEDSNQPTGNEYYKYLNRARVDLLSAESQRDSAIELLYSILEAEDPDDVEEVLMMIKKFLEVSF